jgi:TRAP-type mannitol/chloroaromatic compound transport system permease large subunit
MHESMISSMKITAMIMWTVVGAFVFTGAFMSVGGGIVISNILLGLPVGPLTLVLIMGVAFLILGFVMEWVGIVPILVPIFTPVLKQVGIDPLWAAIIFCMIMQTSFLTPPMAPTLFYLKGVAPPEVNFGKHIIVGVIPFLGIQLIGVLLVIFFPSLATWLPSVMYR